MSQDLLTLVKLTAETAKPLGVAARPAEQPAEDFLAVLDRALADRTAQADVSRTHAEAARDESRIDENRRDQGNRQPATETRRTGDSEGARPQPEGQRGDPAEAVRHQAAELPAAGSGEALGSSRLEKYHSRRSELPVVIQTPKAEMASRQAPAREAFRETASADAGAVRQTMAQALSAQGLIGRAPAKSEGGARAAGPAQAELHPVSRKLDHKTGQAEAPQAIPLRQKKLADQAEGPDEAPSAKLNAKKPADQQIRGKAEIAAEKMQLHADSGGTKGLHDALNVVKNLADTLGLNQAKNGDVLQAANRTIDLGSQPFGLAMARPAPGAAGAKADNEDRNQSLRASRVEVLRAQRLGNGEGAEMLRQAVDQGRVQVVDRSAAAFKPSLVLQSMLADKSPSGQTGRAEDSGRRDSLQLVNTAFLSPAAERNSVSIPVHLTATQQGNLQHALRSHLADRGNSDIVQQARIIMNGQDSGEIKLILKPENLGEVRIHLQMNDGHIAGQIFVENKEVQAAFEDNMASLMQAFQDGGLNAADLQVTVDQRGSGQNGQPQQQFAGDRADERRKIHAVRSLESSVATVTAADSAYSQVNLVV